MREEVLAKEETRLIRTPVGTFELVEEFRNGWNPDAFKERYSNILDKYDYIVGDWGYGQLRLRGFYENTNRRVPFEQRIATLDEYLHEFCNFGCAYFVLRRVKSALDAYVPADAGEEAEDAPTIMTQPETEWRSARAEQEDRRPRQPEQERPKGGRQGQHHRPERERGDAHGRGERLAKTDKPGHGRSESRDRPHRNDRGRKGDRGKDRHKHAPGARPGREKVAQRPEGIDHSQRT